MRITSILHPTDFSECARRALTVAVYLAVSRRATLHVFHALLLHDDDPTVELPEMAAYVDQAQVHAEAWIDHAPAGRLDLRTEVGRGIDAHEAMMDALERTAADLVVMGTHGRSGVRKLLMGSQTDKMLRHAPCHVLTTRADAKLPGPGQDFRRILVPVDFSIHSRRALQAARELAAESGGRITLTHVMSTVVPTHYAASVDTSFELDPRLLSAAERTLREWAAGDDVDTVLAEGLASMEIDRIAREVDADLIVMGTRGLTGLEHVLVGSVTERVCRSASTPVLVVK